ncbi:LysR family transcriptional regulator [Kribbella sp. NPDC004536]|uniref:LysR family transcriptional regulator n=1 Tax=Kribbella sp. NPDC004536 TaxID=3364106 RepID=UPI0036A7376E
MATNLRSLDLNLLLTLDALLAERGVTRAAQRLGVTQPAASAALSRLRRHFGDQLLNRVGNHYELTPLAAQLRADTTLALASVRRVFDSMPNFDPAGTEREFSLVLSDYAAAVMGERISRIFATQAPNARLRIQGPTPHLVDNVADTIRAVDGMVLPHGFIHDLPHADLFSDNWVGIAATGNPLLDSPITLERLADVPWVLTYDSRTAFTPAQQQLRLLGVDPRTAVVVESFAAVPFFVVGTERVAMVQRRLVDRLAGLADITTFALPFEAVRLIESFWWDPAREGDPAHAWLRSVLRTVGDQASS